MATRSVVRSFSVVFTSLVAIVLIALPLKQTPAQAHPQHPATTIACAGSIQACIDAASDGDTIVIAEGTYTESLTLSKPVSLTGANRDTTIIHAVAAQRVLTVTGATISTSVVISGLTFTGGSADYGGGVLLANSAQPLIRNSIFVSNTAQAGGGLYTQGPLLTLIDTDFIANAGSGVDTSFTAAQVVGGQFVSNSGTALRVDGPVEISATRFISNSGGYYAGGVEAYRSATILNAHFENNTGEEAGGLYFNGQRFAGYDGSLILSNTAFISNSGGNAGGAYVDEGIIAVSGGVFDRNTSTEQGGGGLFGYMSRLFMTDTRVLNNTHLWIHEGTGGVVIWWGDAHVSDSLFENNVSHGYYGGGLYADTLFLTNTQVISNAALNSAGGGAYAAEAHLSGGRFERNSSQFYCGGLYASSFAMSGTIFISNTAQYGGGGACAYSSIELTGGRFEGNRTLESHGVGGGLLAQYDSQLTMTGTQFINNVTAGEGGGLYASGPSRLVNTLFTGNSAGEDGAAISFWQYAETRRDLLHVTIADTISNPKAAIAVLSGTLNLTNTIIASHAIGISNTGGTVYEDYNLFFNTVTNTVGVITDGGHSLIGDPKFIDPLHGNYHLQFDSAAIDHGVDAGVYTDLDGNPRPIGLGFDIGAYEFQGIRYLWLPLIRK
jgi:fibronectin-binding autotransporter adhesin